ncbi:MAG TPA: hypothetical protein PLI52_02885 [Prochlorococcaceae cyanobacterium AMR_MDS_5431]|nr:hypothetical protein [Prochlorococcaceae cyanobacterium AMR_MDS_5431]
MGAVVYHLIMSLSSSVILATHKVLRVFAQISYALASLASKEQANYCEAINTQAAELDECKLMQAMLSVQESAIKNNDWDNDQFRELNNLCGRLVTVHGWKQVDVDRYMTLLVNSGPEGYAYEPRSTVQDDEYYLEDDDDDDDYDDDEDY